MYLPTLLAQESPEAFDSISAANSAAAVNWLGTALIISSLILGLSGLFSAWLLTRRQENA